MRRYHTTTTDGPNGRPAARIAALEAVDPHPARWRPDTTREALEDLAHRYNRELATAALILAGAAIIVAGIALVCSAIR